MPACIYMPERPCPQANLCPYWDRQLRDCVYPETGIDWVTDDDGPPWGQDCGKSPEEIHAEWDRYYDGQDLPE